MYIRYFKRLMDLGLALIFLIVFSLLLFSLAVLVYATLGRPILFRQLRPGRSERLFELNKFRSMKNAQNSRGRMLPDRDRMNTFGRFLRSTSLDELPELLNVIKGDMSLVGPRPLLMKYLDRYSPEQMRRHEVRPGITGWAQVNGRNAISWEEKFKLDVWYVDNLSFWLDIKILLLTFWKILTREGINQPGQATAKEFLGSSTITK